MFFATVFLVGALRNSRSNPGSPHRSRWEAADIQRRHMISLQGFWKRRLSELTSLACVGVFVALASCGGEPTGVKATGKEAPALSVVVAPVIQKTVPIFTELTARTDATDSVDIRARVKAFLLKQSYDEGKMVKAGQVLFTLDKREYEAQLMQAKAQLAKAQADLTQAQDRTVVDVAQANLQIAMAQLNKTNQDVKRLKPLAEQRAVPQAGL